MDTVVKARVTEADKLAAAEVLREMGLTISDLLRMTVIRTAKTRQIPFEVGLSPVNQSVVDEIEAGQALRASRDVDLELPSGKTRG
ncbi:type II toxin-antitoxin system RelB/DinJ family antitoxin [Comamonas flocculans]|nr:type II toxin-antitoxin system RelB/DinJ family antitoxin [Comamonas flocculans]